MEEVKKKKKTKSLSAQIRSLKKELKSANNYAEEQWKHIRKLRKKVNELEMLTPSHLYKIEFKMKSNEGSIFTYTEVTESYNFKMAIDNIKKNKTHPDTFELVNLTVLA